MAFFKLKNLPRREQFLDAAKVFPELEPLSYETFLHLLKAGDDAYRISDLYLQREGVSQGKFTLMLLLLDWRELRKPVTRTPAELADLAGVTRATVTGLLDGLERDELITRKADNVDRRRRSVALTEKGLAFLWRVMPERFRQVERFLSVLSKSEQQTFIQLLSRVSARAREDEVFSGHSAQD